MNLQTSPEKSTSAEKDLSPSKAKQEYERRLVAAQKRAEDFRSTDALFSRIRVGVFAAILGFGCTALADAAVSPFWMVLPCSLFFAVLYFHRPIVRKLTRAKSAVRFYQQGLARLAGDWRTFPLSGETFQSAEHPWSGDLDIFGQGSVFQKMNECRTLPAQRKLAEWLTTVADPETVELRQQQTTSLQDEVDLREHLATVDDNVDWHAAEASISGWLAQPASPFPSQALFFARLLGVMMVITLVLFFLGLVPSSALLLIMLLQGPIVFACRQRIRNVLDQIDAAEKPLRQLAEVSSLYESFPFTEKSLQQLQNCLVCDGIPASRHINDLSSRVQWLNNALRNQFFIPIAWALGLFVHLPHRVEKWRSSCGRHVSDWLEALATLEVLSSIAGFNYEQQEHYCVPVISEDVVGLETTSLGHPLLDQTECVRNDVTLTASRPLLLISGSNMSGKSTLLRSIGTNLALSYCGARVNAEHFRSFPFQIGTAMRISDSLQEGRSLFFSVVQRLKGVVDLTRADRPVLFLLDEILSGTNSHDRRRGAEAVIRSLVEGSAQGLVTTHDLTLTEIVNSLDDRGVNMHFEDQVEDGRMTFDYRLRDGVVQRSNAIELMRMMGLDV